MMQDDRTNGQALAGLFDINNHMRDQFVADPAAPMKQAAPSPEPAQPQAPMSVMDQMDQRHGKFKNRMGLLSHAFSGGNASEYGDDDLRLAHKQQTLRGQLGDFDMDNMSMSDVVALSQLSPEMGKYAMEQYQFGRRVDDIGRAQGFMNDGVEDENDLWAQQTFGRYGLTPGGEQTSMTETLARAKMTQDEFDALPAESQRRVLYQYGTEDDRKNADVVAGRKTLDQIEAEAGAESIGKAAGDLTAEAIGFLPNAPKIAQDQDFAMQGVDDLIGMFNRGEIETGKWTQMMKDTFGIQTAADGKLGLEATKNLISQINSATFGALSEREIETLEKTFANGGFTEEANLEILNDVKKKLQLGKDQHGRKTEESLRRIKAKAPDEYEYFMQDDQNWIQYGDPAKLPASESGASFADAWPMMQQDGLSREEAIVQWRDDLKAERDAKAEADKRAEQAKKDAEMAIGEMTDWASSWAGDR